MQDCIFCQVIAGKSPSYKVYEDDHFVGILDIFPVTKGHVLIIPKKHYRWTHDVPEFGKYWEVALKAAKAVQKALKPEWVQYFTHGAIKHAHIHIIPRYDKIENARFFPGDKIEPLSPEELTEIAEKMRKELI